VATIKQLPAVLDLHGEAGRPFTLRVRLTGGHTITAPEVLVRTAAGAVSTFVPSIELDNDVATIVWSLEQTAAMNTSGRAPAGYLWTLRALVDADGPHGLLARSFVVHPAGTADLSTELDVDLAVSVGGPDVELSVSLIGNPVWGSYLFTESGHALTTEAGVLLVAG